MAREYPSMLLSSFGVVGKYPKNVFLSTCSIALHQYLYTGITYYNANGT